MSPHRRRILPALLAATTLLAGCSTNSVKPTPQSAGDQTAIEGTLAALPEFMDDGLFDVAATTSLASSLPGTGSAPAIGAAALDPFFFWRSITSRTRTFEFAFADTDTTGLPTTAVVTLHRRLAGTFNIVPRDPSHPDQPLIGQLVQKPLVDHWVRRFLLKRVRVTFDDRPLWLLAATSGVEVTSKDATTAITSVRVQTATKDTTLTDPMAFIRLRNVLRFDSGDSVKVTVTTPRVDDVVLLYHHDHRRQLHNNGDGTYTGKFYAGFFDGWRHFGVNALSHGTLYDDVAPYDSKAWIFPYAIVGGPSAEYLP